ncbi:PGPGW domain-containing protein [Knoellia sp. CPCC 206453]|uniref:PGPGW domain-containing protein n=1 Tax=Knoellia pratensis TaxID=3404796 RepID=UPI0036182C59
MPEFVEYLIDGGDLSTAERDAMGQALLQVLRPDAAQFQTDIPALQPTDPPGVHAAADALRIAAGKASEKDRDYATTGWLDATDSELWDAYVTFMPWSIDGEVWDREGRQILSVDDGVVTTVGVASKQLPAVVSITGPDRLKPWLEVKAQRRSARFRWMSLHPDTVIGWTFVSIGVVLVPLPGPGWLLVAAGALLLVAGTAARVVLAKRRA